MDFQVLLEEVNMKIDNIDQNNRLLIEQLKKTMAENNKLAEIKNINKESPDKSNLNLESSLLDIEGRLAEENKLRLYDRKGNLDEPKVNSQVISRLKDNNIIDKSIPLINQEIKDKGEREPIEYTTSRRPTAEYFTAIYHLIRDKTDFRQDRDFNRRSRNDRFKIIGLFGLVLVLIVLIYFLLK